MAISRPNPTETEFLQIHQALSRWDNEGGAHPDKAEADIHEMSNTELVHLRIRVIALENLMLMLLAESSDRQLEVAREMASYILPRAGFTQHSLTVKAANQMTDMVKRAEHFRTVCEPSCKRPR